MEEKSLRDINEQINPEAGKNRDGSVPGGRAIQEMGEHKFLSDFSLFTFKNKAGMLEVPKVEYIYGTANVSHDIELGAGIIQAYEAWSSNLGITWELARNAESREPRQTTSVRMYSFKRSPGDFYRQSHLRSANAGT